MSTRNTRSKSRAPPVKDPESSESDSESNSSSSSTDSSEESVQTVSTTSAAGHSVSMSTPLPPSTDRSGFPDLFPTEPMTPVAPVRIASRRQQAASANVFQLEDSEAPSAILPIAVVPDPESDPSSASSSSESSSPSDDGLDARDLRFQQRHQPRPGGRQRRVGARTDLRFPIKGPLLNGSFRRSFSNGFPVPQLPNISIEKIAKCGFKSRFSGSPLTLEAHINGVRSMFPEPDAFIVALVRSFDGPASKWWLYHQVNYFGILGANALAIELRRVFRVANAVRQAWLEFERLRFDGSTTFATFLNQFDNYRRFLHLSDPVAIVTLGCKIPDEFTKDWHPSPHSSYERAVIRLETCVDRFYAKLEASETNRASSTRNRIRFTTPSSPRAQPERARGRSTTTCRIHPESTHADAECRVQSAAARSSDSAIRTSANSPANPRSPPSASASGASSSSTMRCYRCSEIGHSIRDCPKPRAVAKVLSDGSESIRLAVKLNDEPQLTALVDSGASRSFVSDEFAKRLAVPTEPGCSIEMANGVMIESQLARNIRIQRVDRSTVTPVDHDFLVIPSTEDVVIGRDLFGSLGIQIILARAIPTVAPPSLDADTPVHTAELEVEHSDAQFIREQLEPALARNALLVPAT